jgi:hypothetical protein
MADLSADDRQFQRYFRMSKKQFEQILLAVELGEPHEYAQIRLIFLFHSPQNGADA